MERGCRISDGPFPFPKAGIYTPVKKSETENCTEHVALRSTLRFGPC